MCHTLRDPFKAQFSKSSKYCALRLHIPENKDSKHVGNIDEDYNRDNGTYNDAWSWAGIDVERQLR